MATPEEIYPDNPGLKHHQMSQQLFVESAEQFFRWPDSKRDEILSGNYHQSVLAFQEAIEEIISMEYIPDDEKKARIIGLLLADDIRRTKAFNEILEGNIFAVIKPEDIDKLDEDDWLEQVCKLQATKLSLDIYNLKTNAALRVTYMAQWN